MTANIVTMVVFTLAAGQWCIDATSPERKKIGWLGGAITGVFIVAVVTSFSWLSTTGLLGMFLFMIIVGLWIMLLAFVVPAKVVCAENARVLA